MRLNSTSCAQVELVLTPLKLTSYLSNSFFEEMCYFEMTSPTSAQIRLQVEGYMLLPAQQCLPPIVKLITPVGVIHIEGNNLEFDADNVNPFFLEAGFVSKELKLCEDDCFDDNGFLTPNLVGVESISGRPFVVFDEATAMSRTNVRAPDTRICARAWPTLPDLHHR